MRQVVLTVHGDPAPQGSKRHVGGGILVESSKKVKPWRATIGAAVRETCGEFPVPFDGAVAVSLVFHLRRPKSHYGSGRNAGIVKESAPAFPAVQPDVDKLARSTLDGLVQAGLLADDRLIVSLKARKRYTDLHPHCDVVVREELE